MQVDNTDDTSKNEEKKEMDKNAGSDVELSTQLILVNESKEKITASPEKEDGEILNDEDILDEDGVKKSKKDKKKKKKKKKHHSDENLSEDNKKEKKSKKKKRKRSKSPDKSEEKAQKKKTNHSREKKSSFYNLDSYYDKKKSRRRSLSPNHSSDLGYESSKYSRRSSFNSHNRSSSSHSHHHSNRHHHKSSHSIERERKRRRSRSRSQSVFERVDKQKLLEIARVNLAKMIETGALPKGIDINKINLDQLRSLKSENSIGQWTEYCRALSAMEAAVGSPESFSDPDVFSPSEDENEDDDKKSSYSMGIRHPFTIKERKDIQIKVRDFPQLSSRTAKEIQKDLLDQFPVSSGDQHRFKELEWKEVEKMPPPTEIPKPKPKKVQEEHIPANSTKPIEPIGPVEQESSSVTAETSQSTDSGPDIGIIMAQRLAAMKKLQQDPLNVVALKQMYEAERMMQDWTKSQVVPGQFTGSTGVNPLSPEELEGIRPAWARKEQFSNANKIKDGIGMHLLMKMGWLPGKGLGKNCEGVTEPIVPSLKFDTKGLVSEDEVVKNIPAQVVDIAELSEGKHPVSLLQEHCAKNKWLLPEYVIVQQEGPDHKKCFIMKAVVNGIEYQPSVSCGTKKQAKALAATVALQTFGLMPKDDE